MSKDEAIAAQLKRQEEDIENLKKAVLCLAEMHDRNHTIIAEDGIHPTSKAEVFINMILERETHEPTN